MGRILPITVYVVLIYFKYPLKHRISVFLVLILRIISIDYYNFNVSNSLLIYVKLRLRDNADSLKTCLLMILSK